MPKNRLTYRGVYKCAPIKCIILWLTTGLLAGLAACGSVTPSNVPTATESVTLPPKPTATRPPTPTDTQTPTATPTQLCSPLGGETVTSLGDIVTNVFNVPAPFEDEGHHGADFAYWTKNGAPMVGLPVLSILPGKVVALTNNRPPYGHMMIIETPLESVPEGIVPTDVRPLEAPHPSYRLTCPAYPAQPPWKSDGTLSVYVLYAHIDIQARLKIGDTLTCGQKVGQIAEVGSMKRDFSTAPHLHMETRIGPSGMVFASMAHYIGDATDQDMLNYCLWRISGMFAAFDPMRLFRSYVKVFPQTTLTPASSQQQTGIPATLTTVQPTSTP